MIHFDARIRILIIRRFQNVPTELTYFDFRTFVCPEQQVRFLQSRSLPTVVNLEKNFQMEHYTLIVVSEFGLLEH